MVQDKIVQGRRPSGARETVGQGADPAQAPRQVMIPIAKAKEQALAHFNAGRFKLAAQVCAQLVRATCSPRIARRFANVNARDFAVAHPLHTRLVHKEMTMNTDCKTALKRP